MLRNKQTSMERWPSECGRHGLSSLAGVNEYEPALLDFLDTLDLELFLCDPDYRRRLNALLDRFTDEEFEAFADFHSRRFTLN